MVAGPAGNKLRLGLGTVLGEFADELGVSL